LILCVHGGKHAWECLKWLTDVAALVRRYPDLDYEGLVAEALEARCRKPILLGLLLSHDLLGAPVPNPILTAARRDASIRWMSNRIVERMFDTAPSRHGKARIEMRLEEGLARQARYACIRLLSPHTDDWTPQAHGPIGRLRGSLRAVSFLIGRSLHPHANE
jgi:hypothetical protein